MHAQAAAHLRHADEFAHKLRLLALELGKLIHNDKEVRHWCVGPTFFAERRILIDTFDAVPFKNPLPPAYLTLDGRHGTAYQRPGQVGDRPLHMGQPGEEICHAAALVVDEEEGDIRRAEGHGQRENVGLQRLGFATAGRAGHQAVGAVGLFVCVQSAQTVRCHTNGHGQRLPGAGRLPAVGGAEFGGAAHAVEREKVNALGQGLRGGGIADDSAGQAAHSGVQLGRVGGIQRGQRRSNAVDTQHARAGGGLFKNAAAGVGQFGGGVGQKHRCNAGISGRV